MGRIYGRLAASFGWTFQDIDEMFLDDANLALEQLNTSPPTHELVAAYLGFKPKEPAKRVRKEDVAEIMKFLGG